jgi:uncharacterized membrane protein
MNETRLEALRDGVIAILITIVVLQRSRCRKARLPGP